MYYLDFCKCWFVSCVFSDCSVWPSVHNHMSRKTRLCNDLLCIDGMFYSLLIGWLPARHIPDIKPINTLSHFPFRPRVVTSPSVIHVLLLGRVNCFRSPTVLYPPILRNSFCTCTRPAVDPQSPYISGFQLQQAQARSTYMGTPIVIGGSIRKF